MILDKDSVLGLVHSTELSGVFERSLSRTAAVSCLFFDQLPAKYSDLAVHISKARLEIDRKLIHHQSISVIQWLLNADSTSHSPQARLTRFFTTLHAALRNPSRAVFQFYPSSDDQVHMITSAAQKAGFGGGLVVDYPNSRKARKMYLVLMVGQQEVPKALDGTEAGMDVVGNDTNGKRRREEVLNEKRRRKEKGGNSGKKKKGSKKDLAGKDWVMKKKDLYRQRGKEG